MAITSRVKPAWRGRTALGWIVVVVMMLFTW
jgi:hypothetical protein